MDSDNNIASNPEAESAQTKSVLNKKPKNKKRLIILVSILGGLIVLGAIGGVGYYIYLQNQKLSQLEQDDQNSKNKTETTQKPAEADITWITPQKVDNLGLFNDAKYKDYMIENAYYKVANTKDGGEVYLVQTSMGPGGYNYYRFKKLGGQYYFLKAISAELYPDAGYLVSTVQTDSTTTYPGLTAPKSLALKNGTSFGNGYASKLFAEFLNPTKIENTQFGDFYVINDTNNGKLKTIINRDFFLKLADSSTYQYSLDLKYFNKESYIPNVTINGVQNSDQYNDFIMPGCGRFDSTIMANYSSNAGNLTKIGSTSSGESVYGVTNLNSDFAKEIYMIYKEMNDSGGLNPDAPGIKNLTIAQYYALNPKAVFVVPDGLGKYLVFVRHEFKGAGGCAKPVIYLYPTKEMSVDVKVGADVTISDPRYNQGWKVTASPNGTIKLGGKTYDYLFWEGQGNGSYPKIDRGFVARQADLKQTLNDHLTKLGLNAKEKADFMDFWMAKLPTTPYVRLTWLMTADMNRLAPLTINPKPDSLIRIFLDYEGLQNPIDIKPQNLYSIPRKGFTVVEWGGLNSW